MVIHCLEFICLILCDCSDEISIPAVNTDNAAAGDSPKNDK